MTTLTRAEIKNIENMDYIKNQQELIIDENETAAGLERLFDKEARKHNTELNIAFLEAIEFRQNHNALLIVQDAVEAKISREFTREMVFMGTPAGTQKITILGTDEYFAAFKQGLDAFDSRKNELPAPVKNFYTVIFG